MRLTGAACASNLSFEIMWAPEWADAFGQGVGGERVRSTAVTDPAGATVEERVRPPSGESALGRRNLIVAAALFVGALGMLLAIQRHFGIGVMSISTYPQFVHQAQSFLQGRWDLDMPWKTNDLEVINGKNYMYYPPFPAVLLLPFVAVSGLRTSDVLFTAAVSATIISSLYLLLEQIRSMGLTRRTWVENAILSVLLYFGSITLMLSLDGRLWFTTHIVVMATTLPALLLAFRRHYAWSAVLLGCAFFTRFSVAIGFIFLFYLAWQDAGVDPLLWRFVESLRRMRPDWAAVPWRRLLPPAAVTLGVIALFFLRNAFVFGSPTDDGYHQLIQQQYDNVLQSGGIFNLGYIKGNIATYFLATPRVEWLGGRWDRHPVVDLLNDQISVSVFITTPLFLLMFWRNARFSELRAVLWLVISLVVLSLLPFYSTGAFQFGARYLTDAYPYAFLLLALTDMRLDWRAMALGALGIVINYIGAAQFWTGQLLHL